MDGFRTGRTEKIPASDVVTYTLSPEELAEYNRQHPPKSIKRTVIETDSERIARERAKQEKTEEESDVKLTKDEYLGLRLQGQTREEIAAALGMTETSLKKNYLHRWGLYRAQDEQEVLASMAPDAKKPVSDGGTPWVGFNPDVLGSLGYATVDGADPVERAAAPV